VKSDILLSERPPGSKEKDGCYDVANNRLISFPHHMSMIRDSSVGTATGYGLEDRMVGVRIPAGAGNIFDTMSRQALGSTQPPIQWASGALSLTMKLSMGVKKKDSGNPSSLASSSLPSQYWQWGLRRKKKLAPLVKRLKALVRVQSRVGSDMKPQLRTEFCDNVLAGRACCTPERWSRVSS
jgi:hypothetical protein